MPEAAASQGGDSQQSVGDAMDHLNEDPPIVGLVDSEDSHKDSMNVDDLAKGPPAEAGAEAESAEDQVVDAEGEVEVCEEAPLTRKGVAQQD